MSCLVNRPIFWQRIQGGTRYDKQILSHRLIVDSWLWRSPLLLPLRFPTNHFKTFRVVQFCAIFACNAECTRTFCHLFHLFHHFSPQSWHLALVFLRLKELRHQITGPIHCPNLSMSPSCAIEVQSKVSPPRRFFPPNLHNWGLRPNVFVDPNSKYP